MPTKNASAPSTAHMSALFSVQCADKFHKALNTLLRVDSYQETEYMSSRVLTITLRMSMLTSIEKSVSLF